MQKQYAVVCKTKGKTAEEVLSGKRCKTVFTFGFGADIAPKIEFPCPPLGGLECPRCHQKHSYGSDDVLEVVLLPC